DDPLQYGAGGHYRVLVGGAFGDLGCQLLGLLLVESEQCLVLGVEIVEEGPRRDLDFGTNVLDGHRIGAVPSIQADRCGTQRGPCRSLFPLPQPTAGTPARGAHQQSPTNGIFLHRLQNYIQCSHGTPCPATCDDSRRPACSRRDMRTLTTTITCRDRQEDVPSSCGPAS